MLPEVYQRLAARTECDQAKSRQRMSLSSWGLGDHPLPEFLLPIRVNHAVVGLSGEVGELAAILQRWIYYGKEYSSEDLRRLFTDELGDCLWYMALAMNALSLDMGEVMRANLRKLVARYPDRYTDAAADEGNRDRVKETAALAEVVEGSAMKTIADAVVLQGLSTKPMGEKADGTYFNCADVRPCGEPIAKEGLHPSPTEMMEGINRVAASVVAGSPTNVHRTVFSQPEEERTGGVCLHCRGLGMVSCEWSKELTDCPVCKCADGGFHRWYHITSSVGSGKVCLRCRKTEPE